MSCGCVEAPKLDLKNIEHGVDGFLIDETTPKSYIKIISRLEKNKNFITKFQKCCK